MTVAAGVTTAYYENKLPAGSPVIRVMPNAPVVVGGGVSALARGRFATRAPQGGVGHLRRGRRGAHLPESQLDAVTAVSGSGPAYFFLMVEALIDAGVAVGLVPVATDLAVQTMAGSAAMLLERLDEAQPVGDAAMGTAMDTTRRNCAPRLPRPAAPPPLVCANSNAAVCGRRLPTPCWRPKSALSSWELHQSNSNKF